jgi:hypothetical protein
VFRSERFGMVLTPDEKHALNKLAEAEGGLSRAATVRRLIRKEAQQLGLWPFKSTRQRDDMEEISR